MDGIEFLSHEIVYNTVVPPALSIALMIGLVILTCLGVLIKNRARAILYFVAMFLAAVAIFFAGMAPDKTSVSFVEYKVIVDDSVSLNRFLDTYEIVDRDGKIYVIRERP